MFDIFSGDSKIKMDIFERKLVDMCVIAFLYCRSFEPIEN